MQDNEKGLEDGIYHEAGTTNLSAYDGNMIKITDCLILYIISGHARVSICFKQRTLKQGRIVLLFYYDTFHIIEASKDFSAKYISLPYKHIWEAMYKMTSTRFWNNLALAPVLVTTLRQRQLFLQWWRQTEWILENCDTEYREQMLSNNICNLYMGIDNEFSRFHAGGKEKSGRSWALMLRFFKLLSLHCRENREVKFFADKLCITTTYLNKLTHRYCDMSPKEMIDEQTLCEMKALLSTTDLSIKSVAEKLCFEDVSYMCRYFRRLSGMTPMKFRVQKEERTKQTE